MMRLELKALPNMGQVGGNARPGHYMKGARVRREEKEMWILAIREQLMPPMPRFTKAMVEVTLVFPQARNRDQDNVAMALKPLWDAMVHWEMMPDDSPRYLEVVSVRTVVALGQAPLTILEIGEAT